MWVIHTHFLQTFTRPAFPFNPGTVCGPCVNVTALRNVLAAQLCLRLSFCRHLGSLQGLPHPLGPGTLLGGSLCELRREMHWTSAVKVITEWKVLGVPFQLIWFCSSVVGPPAPAVVEGEQKVGHTVAVHSGAGVHITGSYVCDSSMMTSVLRLNHSCRKSQSQRPCVQSPCSSLHVYADWGHQSICRLSSI